MGSGGPPDPAASALREEDDEGSATTRRRIAYSREFLISVGTSSEACKRLPVGFDASKLSQLCLLETGSRGSGIAESRSDQLDWHPGNQCRPNWQSKQQDGLLGSGAFPRIPCYAVPLASNGQGSGYRLTPSAGGYRPTRQYMAPPVSPKYVDLINTKTSGSSENWSKDRVEEERKRRAFQLIRKEQRQALQEKKKAADSEKENLGDGTISSLQNSAGKRDPLIIRDKQDGLNVSPLFKEDAIETAPLLPTPTTTPLKPLGFTNGLSQKRLQIQSFNTSQNSEIQLLNTDDMMVSSAPESSISAQWFSGGGILGAGHTDTLSPKQMVPFGHRKCGPFHLRPGTVVECDNPTFSDLNQEGLEIHLPEEDTLFSVNDFSYTQNTDQGSAGEGANFDEEGLEICLPEEDALISVNDFLYTQNTDLWSAAEWGIAEGLAAKDEAPNINSRFQSLDVSRTHFHDQIGPNNRFHLFGSRPDAESAKRSAGAMSIPSRPCDRDRQAPFDMPKATHHGAYFPFPQDLKSMQGVGPASGGPCAGLAAPHHILSHMTMPGSSLPLQGFLRCAPHMFYHRTEMAVANSFQMHRCQPGYGETGMTMTGPPVPGLEGYHAGPFDRPVQAEPRGRSRQMHPELAGPVHSFHGHFRR